MRWSLRVVFVCYLTLTEADRLTLHDEKLPAANETLWKEYAVVDAEIEALLKYRAEIEAVLKKGADMGTVTEKHVNAPEKRKVHFETPLKKLDKMIKTNNTSAKFNNHTVAHQKSFKDDYEQFIIEFKTALKSSVKTKTTDKFLNLRAKNEALLKTRTESKAKLEKDLEKCDTIFKNSLKKERTNDYEIKTLHKTLRIYCDPTLTMRSILNGGLGLTGDTVWDSAEALAIYLDTCVDQFCMRGKKVLDLSAGTGYVGIVAACFGADVTLTDIPSMMPLLQKNIDANLRQLEGTGGKIRAKVLRWGNAEEIKSLPKQDIILLSNVVYYDLALEPLLATVAALSYKGTTMIVSQETWKSERQISLWNKFCRLASEHFSLSLISPKILNRGYGDDDIWLMQGTFK